MALEAGGAHHEEFVEVVGRNGQEAHPLQQRMMLVAGLFQDPAVEVQPGQFAVNESLRLRAQTGAGRGNGCRRGFVTVADRSDFLNRCKSLGAICHSNEGLKGRIPIR